MGTLLMLLVIITIATLIFFTIIGGIIGCVLLGEYGLYKLIKKLVTNCKNEES